MMQKSEKDDRLPTTDDDVIRRRFVTATALNVNANLSLSNQIKAS